MRRPLPIKKPTPAEIGAMIVEDEFGLPIMAQSPVSPAIAPQGSLSAFNDSQQGEGSAPYMSGCTKMRACMAESCVHNDNGHCRLDEIEVNQHGGCQQYEATAEGADAEQSRYDEIETSDPTGGSAPVPGMPGMPGMQAMDSQRATNGPWDPRGGGY
jgi:hypothetical protein